MSKLFTSAEVAAELGVSRAGLWGRANREGRQLVPTYMAGIALWSREQVEALRAPLTPLGSRPGFLSYPQAAKALGVSTTTLRKRLGERKIRPDRWRGSCWLTEKQLGKLR